MMLPTCRYSLLTLAVCLAVGAKAAAAEDDSGFDQDFMNLPPPSAAVISISTPFSKKRTCCRAAIPSQY